MISKLVLLFSWTPMLVVYACTTSEKPISAMNFEAIRSELLQDSGLVGKEGLIGSILQFYEKELSGQFSQRVAIDSDREIEIFLDALNMKRIDSLSEIIDASSLSKVIVVPDSQIVTKEYLIDNIRHAIISRGQFPWNRSIPDSIFLNYLLPYKVVHEFPENWWNYLEPYYRDSLSMHVVCSNIHWI